MIGNTSCEHILNAQLSKQINNEDMIVYVSADFQHFIIFAIIINYPTFLIFPQISIHCTRVEAPPTAYHQWCLYEMFEHASIENISKAQLPEQINLEDMIENIQNNPPYSDIPALPPPTATYSCLQPPIAGYWWRQAGVAGLVRNPNVNHQQKSKSKIGERSDLSDH